MKGENELNCLCVMIMFRAKTQKSKGAKLKILIAEVV